MLSTEWSAEPVDLADADAAGAMVDRAIAKWGRLDAVINNAGWSAAATIPQSDAAFISRVFGVNAVAPAVIISRAWPALERQARAGGRGGVIVNVSSMATVDPFEMLYAYAAAKASVNLMARSVAKAGSKLGIRGFAVAPGAVETDLLRSMFPVTSLPASKALAPGAVADVILACVRGERDAENGGTILVPSP
jgi:NAD(P)-dependent dehydrogenase (short-subunit alcohol dehydrogenase family)